VLPEDLDWDTRVEDAALSMDAIKRCLANMLVALDRDTPQTKVGMALPLACAEQELITAQEPPWRWFTLPELGFPMITDEYKNPNPSRGGRIHEKICHRKTRLGNSRRRGLLGHELQRTYNGDEGKNQVTSTHVVGGHPAEQQQERQQQKLERERFSVPHASRDPETLADRNLGNEDIFDIIRNPPEMGVVRIFEKPEFWDTTKGLTKAGTTQRIATIQLASGLLSLDGAQWQLLKHTLDDSDTSPLGLNIQHELKRQLRLDKDRKHRSYAWKVLRAMKEVFRATKYQGDTALTIPPFFKNAGRGNERIWGERISTPQPMVINWLGLR